MANRIRKEVRSMIISCTSDKKYIPLLRILLKSLGMNSPATAVHVRLVNCDSIAVNYVKHLHKNITVQSDISDASTERKNLGRNKTLLYGSLFNNNEHSWLGPSKRSKQVEGGFKGPRWAVSDLQCYCSNIRFRNIHDLLKQGHDSVLYMDVDAIVRKDLNQLEQIIKSNDIVIKTNKYIRDVEPTDLPDGIEWHCGLIGVNNTPQSRKFIEALMINTEKDMYYWDSDQDQFNNVYKSIGHTVQIDDIPTSFKDQGPDDDGRDDFNHDSHIWSGAGYIKSGNEKYVKEMKKYE